jgi:hypothetical protein
MTVKLRVYYPPLLAVLNLGSIIHLKDFEFINKPPISRINPLKYVWEVRRDSGLDYDKTDPAQKLLVMQLKNIFPSENILQI